MNFKLIVITSHMQVTFDPEPRRQYLKLLGYDTDELAKKVRD